MKPRRGNRRRPRLWVGWREWIGLPQLGIEAIKAKVDTGAATSALHAIHIHALRDNGRDRVAFEVHPLQRRTDRTVHCAADLLDERVVTSSTGHRERRFIIRTPMVIAGQRFPIELSLTNRDTMGFRMLIGRRAMKRRLLVDPGASYLAGAADEELWVQRPRPGRAE
ncbi:ATP-dependent zinc protease family protein [Arhodomonas sp. SL1]|uniref:ATP-dependent zinc protease family protein n=1 Tax=Arhodomonas sp. SL1 TaxID=3425691 RepID=UPI003F8812AA